MPSGKDNKLKRIRSKNPVNWDDPDDVTPTMEQEIEFLRRIWELLEIEGTPTENDVINKPTVELETRRMINKYAKYP